MSEKVEGPISAALFSLQLQLKTLLEEAGGDQATALLDALCKLNQSERKILLEIFGRTIERIAGGTLRLPSEGEEELKNVEENLYQEILREMHNASNDPQLKRFGVVDGGKKAAHSKSLIDFATAVKNRKQRPLFN